MRKEYVYIFYIFFKVSVILVFKWDKDILRKEDCRLKFL